MPNKSVKILAVSVVACGMAISVGCQSNSGNINLGGEDGIKVASAVEELNEVKHNPKKSNDFFVTKPDSTKSKQLNQFTFYVAGKPSVSGSTATCKILIERANGTPVGDQEWTFEKVADKWKIKSFPLP